MIVMLRNAACRRNYENLFPFDKIYSLFAAKLRILIFDIFLGFVQ